MWFEDTTRTSLAGKAALAQQAAAISSKLGGKDAVGTLGIYHKDEGSKHLKQGGLAFNSTHLNSYKFS